MKTSPPFSLCALIATAAPLIGSGCVTQMGQGSGANPVERSVAVDSEGAPIADPPRPGAPQLLRPLPDARVLLITPSGQCMFPFAAQLSGPSLSWAAPEAIPIALQGTVGPARPLIRVNEFQVCILYGTQRCTTDSVNTRRAQDAINLGAVRLPTMCLFPSTIRTCRSRRGGLRRSRCHRIWSNRVGIRRNTPFTPAPSPTRNCFRIRFPGARSNGRCAPAGITPQGGVSTATRARASRSHSSADGLSGVAPMQDGIRQ